MANVGHNVADLKKVIRDCATQMTKIKGERAELNERAGDIRERLREAGVQTQAFDFACRVQAMEQEARDEYLDSLRVNFDALGVGVQSEMFVEAAAVGDAKGAAGNDAAKGNSEDKATKAKKTKSKATKAAKVSRGVKAEGAPAQSP